jgi:DnaJ-class molecular chaperone
VTSKPDYYGVLGVKKTATDDELRRAFRKKAVVLHPDRNPNDKAAEAKFKLITQAYDILSDSPRRKKYDQEISAPLPPPPPPPNYPVADVCVEVELSPRDHQEGVEKTVTVARPRQCPDCGGSGKYWARCQLCYGSGCQACNWSGNQSCARCWGKGIDRELTTLRVVVPQGTPPYGRQKLVALGNLWGVPGPFYVYANIMVRVQKPGMILS